jgi:hypothetical protein
MLLNEGKRMEIQRVWYDLIFIRKKKHHWILSVHFANLCVRHLHSSYFLVWLDAPASPLTEARSLATNLANSSPFFEPESKSHRKEF